MYERAVPPARGSQPRDPPAPPPVPGPEPGAFRVFLYGESTVAGFPIPEFCIARFALVEPEPPGGVVVVTRRTRDFAANLVLAAASLLVTLTALELVAPWILIRLPLKLHFALDRYQRPLAQTSKQGTVPRDGYVGLLGDSYAMGLGDWLLDADPDTNPPFQAAHVLHDLLDRDVLSFARSGDSSLGAWVKRPFQTLAWLETTRFALPRPGMFVAYFYEGNDLEDNLRDLEGTLAGPDDPLLADPDAFARLIETEFIETGRPERLRPRLIERAVVTRVIRKTLAGALTGWPEGFEPHVIFPGDTNRAIVGGREVALPEPLQSASVGLDEEQLATALYATDQSLRYLREHMPEVPVLVVFIPAPVTTYAISSPQVRITGSGDPPLIVARGEVAARSDRVCAHLARTAQSQGAGFLDVRRELWPIARERLLHGPRDWAHFNRDGYTALAEPIAPAIATRPLPVRPCESVADHFAEVDGLAAAVVRLTP